MHHIKSDARRAAYNDKLNPFGRYRPTSQKRRNTASRAEQGQLSPLTQTNTLPDNFRPGSRQEDDIAPHQQSHVPRGQTTDPTSNSSPPEKTTQFEEQPSFVSSPRDELDDAFADKKGATERTKTDSDQTYGTDSTLQQRGLDEKPKRRRDKWNPIALANAHSAKHQQEELDDNGKEKHAHKFTLMGTLRATVFGSWINILLIASPVGIALHFTSVKPVVVFVINFIAIIPLAGMLSYATEEIALRTGEVIGGLLNASFGNAVELITAIIALFQNQYLIVQTSLIGSMLSNLLLVMGMCFFFGGINRMEQAFNITVAQTAASLLFLAVSSLIIPTAFEAWADTGNSSDRTQADQAPVRGVLELSHGTAVILLLIYACYLFFQLKSHVTIYTAASEKNKSRFTEDQKESWKQKSGVRKLQQLKPRKSSAVNSKPPTPESARNPEQENIEDDDDEEEQPRISFVSAVVTLAVSTALVAVNAEFLVDSINAVTCGTAISKTFVGLILLPIVGNAAEHATAVTVAIKDKMDLAIGVAVGSSMQIALLILPLVVVIGWIAGKDGMTLYFDGFQVAMLFVSVLLVNYLIADGKSHWLEGVLLMMLYIIIAVAAWFYPTDPAASGCEG